MAKVASIRDRFHAKMERHRKAMQDEFMVNQRNVSDPEVEMACLGAKMEESEHAEEILAQVLRGR